MGEAAPRNVLAETARLILATLAEAGVREVVVSPGSRSTPWVLAALAHPGLRCHSVVDERAAGYFALGLARASGRPAVLLSTSGTAGANYLPAVVEAGVAHVPLVVLTADRPVELTHGGANQTIDQLKLFGDHARRFFDLGIADADLRALRGIRRLVAQAVATSRFPSAGAVHLNVRARKPLEPSTEPTPADLELASKVDALLARPAVRVDRPRLVPEPEVVDDLVAAAGRAQRPMVVVGPAALADGRVLSQAVGRFAHAVGAPVLADPASPCRYLGRSADDDALVVGTYDLVLRGRSPGSGEGGEPSEPDLVIQVGRAPTSGAWERWLTQADVEHWVLAEQGWPDAANTADRLAACHPETLLEAVADRLGPSAKASPWFECWRRLDHEARGVLDAELQATPGLSEGAVARSVVAALGALDDGGLLVVGNSLPIRQLDLWAPGSTAPLRVASQRGASGIDGLVAGAAGAALAHGESTILLIGDVSFLHDLSGLATVQAVPTPLVIVVVQNRGGRIFEQLPVAGHPALPASEDGSDPLDLWTTPHDADFEHAAALHGLPFRRVDGTATLDTVLIEALATPGPTLVEAVVPPDGARRQTAAVVARWRSRQSEGGA